MTTRTCTFVATAILGALAGCGSSGPASDTRAAGDLGRTGSDSKPDRGATADTGSAEAEKDGGSEPSSFDGSVPAAPMPLISGGAPAFASAGDAAAANDANPARAWATSATAAWIAYDLSAVPVAQRQRALIAWYAIRSPCYIDQRSTSGERPLAYTIETNMAPGGASTPTSGWTAALTVADNRYCGRHHDLHLGGANWIRMNVSRSTPDGISLDLAVHSAPDGATDSWLFMGDSITAMTLTHAFSDLPAQVRAQAPAYYPAVIDAAIGGTNTTTALEVIDDTMKDFPGRFVVLAYGTNDHANEFRMSELVSRVIAAGKVPVVPRMPWASGSREGAQINALIDTLYVTRPEIVRGADLWKALEGHTEWIPAGDVHPTTAGQAEIRRQWAKAMAEAYRR